MGILKNILFFIMGIITFPLWIPAGAIFLFWLCFVVPRKANDPNRKKVWIRLF